MADTRDESPSADRPVRVSLRILRAVSRVVPAAVRTAWLRQWRAELIHRRRALAAVSGRRPSALRLSLWSLGAVRHALWLRRRELRGETLLQDLGYALRGLRRRRGLSGLAIVTLAVGIGATTALFSVVNGALLRPLPYQDPDQLVMVYQIQKDWIESSDPFFAEMGAKFPASYPIYEEWRQQEDVFAGVAAYTGAAYTMRRPEGAERVWGTSVAGDLPAVLGVRPELGRWFLPDEDRAGAPRVAVIEHGFWQDRLGGDPDVLGRELTLDDSTYEIVGVMPAGFTFPSGGSLWTNLDDESRQMGWSDAGLNVIARLRDGLGLEAARRRLEAFTAGLTESNPDVGNVGVRVIPRLEEVVGRARASFLLLMGAAALLLLIACANVGSLLLVRGAERRREVAVRSALGAGRSRILRQFLAESVLLGLCGGLLGAVLAWRATAAIVRLLPPEMRVRPISVDARVLLFALATALLTGLAVGLIGCLDILRRSPARTLAASGRASGGRGHQRALSAVVVAQVALALVLLIGATLLVASMQRLMAVEPGFHEEGVTTIAVALPEDGYAEPATVSSFAERGIAELERFPGVQHAAVTDSLPFANGSSSTTFKLEGGDAGDDQFAYSALVKSVTPEYFATLGIPVRAGRVFTAGDSATAEAVLVVNEELARTFFPGESPLGKRMRRHDDDPWARIVGVVGNVRHLGLQHEIRPIAYSPFAQDPDRGFRFAVLGLSEGDSDAARQAVANLDPAVPIVSMDSLSDLVRASVARPRSRTILMTIAATLAVALAMIGVYGAIAYAVRQRTREIGIRIAVGARGGNVVRHVLRWGLSLTALGVALGVGASLLIGRLLNGFLFEVTATDPLVLWGASALLAVVACGACLRPAWRAARTDPTSVLRAD